MRQIVFRSYYYFNVFDSSIGIGSKHNSYYTYYIMRAESQDNTKWKTMKIILMRYYHIVLYDAITGRVNGFYSRSCEKDKGPSIDNEYRVTSVISRRN